MIIEFFGKIGSGKSTLAKELCKNKKLNIVKISSKPEKYFLAVLFMLKNPFKSSYLLRNAAKRKFKLRKISLVIFNMARYQKAKMKKGDNILDEGFLQAIFSILDYNLKEDDIKKYFGYIPFPDKLIIVEIDEKIRKKRLNKRGYDLPEKMFGTLYGTKWHKLMNKNYQIIKEFLMRRNKNLLIIKNNKEINIAAKEIAKNLK